MRTAAIVSQQSPAGVVSAQAANGIAMRPSDPASPPIERKKGPVFVLGCGRSGTTMMRLMLTAHPNIAIPPEGTFMMDLFRRYHRGGAPLRGTIDAFGERVLRSRHFRDWGLDREQVLAQMRAVAEPTYAKLVDAVYRVYLSKLGAGKCRWGDKNIDYVLEIPRVLKLFPTAKIIHMIRDGRDVACSYRNVEFGPRTLFGTAVFWRKRTLTGRAAGRWAGPDRYCEVQYEELVAQPEAQCRRICDFLDETYDPQMLAFHEYNKKKGLVPESSRAWHKHTLQPVTNSRVGQWRREMSEHDLMIFEAIAGSALRRFGYETHGFRVPVSMRAELIGMGATWFYRGLARRTKEFVRDRIRPPTV